MLTYAAGDETHSLRLEAAALEEAQGRLSAELTAGVSMFDSDKAEAVLRLTNAGAVDYVGLTIYDDAYGGVIADGIDVPAGGEPVEVAHTYPLRGDAVYRWRIVGANATGARVDFVTDDQAVGRSRRRAGAGAARGAVAAAHPPRGLCDVHRRGCQLWRRAGAARRDLRGVARRGRAARRGAHGRADRLRGAAGGGAERRLRLHRRL